MYCLIFMKTTKSDECCHFQKRELTTYQIKFLTAKTEYELISKFYKTAKEWMLNHPDYDKLQLTDFKISNIMLRYPHNIVECYKEDAESDIPDVMSHVYSAETEECRCEISARGCWGYTWSEFVTEINEYANLPANPTFFDSSAIESEDAYESIYGDLGDTANWWNRTAWSLKYGIDEKDGFIDEINMELLLISQNQTKGITHLNYFEGQY